MTVEHGNSVNMEYSENMTNPPINKMDPRYIAACIEEQPTLTDSQEVEIIKITEKEALSTPLGKRMVEEVRLAVKNNWRDQYVNRHDTSYVRTKNQEGVAEFARITNATIVSGQEKLQEVSKEKPVLFSANHIGFYKLAGLSPEELNELGFDGKHPIEDIHYPHIPFYAPLYPVAKLLNDDIYMAAEEEPGTLGELYRATGSIDVPPPANKLLGFERASVGRVDILTESAKMLFEGHPNSALSVFTEGGTTGKRNGGNTRELGQFHTGIFAIAANLEIPIVLLAHRFNPNKGIEISIAGVVRLGKNSTREEIKETAIHAQELTQTALNSLY